ncbi:MAG: hypothetical protein N3I35_06825 [Clostridia bacterium]|nr:hypothetical protein [Clostridia bacterium]
MTIEEKNERIEEILIKLQGLYFRDSDVGLCGCERSEVWYLEKELEALQSEVQPK